MKILKITLYFNLIFGVIACNVSDKNPNFKIQNPLEITLDDIVIEIDLENLLLNTGATEIKNLSFQDTIDIPFELVDDNQDGKLDLLLLNINLQPGETINIILNRDSNSAATFPKRSYAEVSHKVGGKWEGRKYIGGSFKNVSSLMVPPEHTDHSSYIRYEGPGWESDKVGYRFYMDWRNGVDVFGKRIDDLILDQVGLDGFDSYHEDQPWGMDILKVGSALGIGSIAMMNEGNALRVEKTDSVFIEIAENGKLRSRIITKYFGWETPAFKSTMISDLSILAGSRMSNQKLTFETEVDSICTGIAKHDNCEVLIEQTENWGYLATWGLQSLAGDSLGLAIIYKTNALDQLSEDELNHLIIFKKAQEVNYYFLAAWDKEKEGIKNKREFKQYLDKQLLFMENNMNIIF